MTRACTCAHYYRTTLPAITGRFTPLPGSRSSTFGGDAVSRGQSCDEGKTTGAGGRRGRGGDHVVCGIALAHPHADRRGPSPHPLPERRDRLPAHRGRQPIFFLRVEATACGAWAARRLRAAWRRASSRGGASLSASSHPSPTTPPTPAAHCLRGGACLHEGLTARRASPLLSGHLNKIFLPVKRPGFERSHTLARARSVAFVVAIVPR